jgi:hypothetical protein
MGGVKEAGEQFPTIQPSKGGNVGPPLSCWLPFHAKSFEGSPAAVFFFVTIGSRTLHKSVEDQW